VIYVKYNVIVYNKHKNSKIHQKKDSYNFIEAQQKSNNYFCEKCSYNTCNKNNFTKHVNTQKHKEIFSEIKESKKIQPKEYKCDCGKVYHDKSGIWKHKKKCSGKKENIIKTCNLSNKLLLEVLKQNNEFKELLVEQNKQIIEQHKIIVDLSSKVTTIITNNSINY
jgi:hypothetical protein